MWLELAAFRDSSYYLLKSGELWGMGRNNNGQLGTGSVSEQILNPVKIASDVKGMTAGDKSLIYEKMMEHFWSLEIMIWSVRRWCHHTFFPHPPKSSAQGCQNFPLNVGSYSFPLYQNDGSLWGMGNNGGKLGNGNGTSQYIPVKILDENMTKVSAGNGHSLFLKK